MFLCKHFVFIHLVKTGGTFVREVLVKNAPEDWGVQVNPGHSSVNAIPVEYADLPIIGFVRNPWDHYVSWYEYCTRAARAAKSPEQLPRNHPFAEVSNFGKNDFRTTLLNIMELPNNSLGGVGGVTSHYADMFGFSLDRLCFVDGAERKIGKFENLREELVTILREIGVPKVPALEQSILNEPPINTMNRPSYQEYYDYELRELVARKDKFIIDRYNYVFE